MKTSLRLRALASGPLLYACLLTACSSEDTPAPATSTTTLSEEYRRLGDNLGQAIALLKSSATSAVTITAADFGEVAPVPKNLTGGGTAATQPSFAAWKGDADSDDAGLCYLAWTKGASWFVASKCGDASGAWVCQVTSAEAVCNACNAAGECAPCDMQQSNFTCTWP